VQDDAAGADLGAGADLDVAENTGAGPDHCPLVYFRMAVSASLPVPPSVTP
jgi:hypothetical protein